MTHRLAVLIGGRRAGTLTQDGRTEFRYDPSYLERETPTPLSLSMPIEAATIVWLSCKANGVPIPGECLQMKDVMSHFGVQQSSVSNRARTLLKAGGFKAVQYGNIALASPDYLVSDRRREIIEMRDRYR